jgi:hypothetical protein
VLVASKITAFPFFEATGKAIKEKGNNYKLGYKMLSVRERVRKLDGMQASNSSFTAPKKRPFMSGIGVKNPLEVLAYMVDEYDVYSNRNCQSQSADKGVAKSCQENETLHESSESVSGMSMKDPVYVEGQFNHQLVSVGDDEAKSVQEMPILIGSSESTSEMSMEEDHKLDLHVGDRDQAAGVLDYSATFAQDQWLVETQDPSILKSLKTKYSDYRLTRPSFLYLFATFTFICVAVIGIWAAPSCRIIMKSTVPRCDGMKAIFQRLGVFLGIFECRDLTPLEEMVQMLLDLAKKFWAPLV